MFLKIDFQPSFAKANNLRLQQPYFGHLSTAATVRVLWSLKTLWWYYLSVALLCCGVFSVVCCPFSAFLLCSPPPRAPYNPYNPYPRCASTTLSSLRPTTLSSLRLHSPILVAPHNPIVVAPNTSPRSLSYLDNTNIFISFVT